MILYCWFNNKAELHIMYGIIYPLTIERLIADLHKKANMIYEQFLERKPWMRMVVAEKQRHDKIYKEVL